MIQSDIWCLQFTFVRQSWTILQQRGEKGACKFAETCLFLRWAEESCLVYIPLYAEPYLRAAVFSLFCSPNVTQLFILSLPLFQTTNHHCARFVFRTTKCLFLIQAAASPLHCPHSLIVFASVCPLLFMEDKTALVQRSSLEVNSAGSQAAQSLPRVWQEAFCHLCRATSPTHHPAHSSNPINTSIWGWSDDLMCWR